MRWILIGLIMALTACSGGPVSFAPSNPIHHGDFSHRLLRQVFETHVHDGVVDYAGIRQDDRFAAYLAQLDRIDPNALPTRQDRLAFWINAYNAFAIQGILNRYSPSNFVGRYRYFIRQQHRVGGETINLYDLERQMLIRQFHEPRVHFAIVCASLSCPKLQAWTYESEELDRQLDAVAKQFINDPTRNRFDRERKVASLSMIFRWFDTDFSAAAGSLSAYLAHYLDDPDLARELTQPGYRIEFLDYDWGLNGIHPGGSHHVDRS